MLADMTTLPVADTLPLQEAALQELRPGLHGQLIRPGDAEYDQARQLWNGTVDKHPALIVRAQAAQDVVLAVTFAQRYDLPVSVRAGGHNSAGLALADNGLVIDLSAMKGIKIDPDRRIARAEPGLTIGEFTAALQPYGLLAPTGTCSGTGIAGMTLGGGIGWLAGRFGLAIDNVLSFELVTAEGELLKASANENTDLFWGLRGSGGNFGVVTAIEYRLHPVGKILGGMILLPVSLDALRFYRDFSSAAPDEVIAYASLPTIPNIGPAIAITVCYSGDDLEAGERALAPLRKFGPPLVDLIRPMEYTELIAMLDPTAPDGRNYYDTAYTLKQPGDDALEAIIACAEQKTSPFSAIILHHVNGAATRVAPEATAFALREPHYAIVNVAAWETGPAEPHIAWAQASLARMQPYASRGLYVNFMGQEGEAALRDSYRANYERLVALKNKYDPANFFRFNQNIKPSVPAK
jgi:FAD/FMN-containing dehydrogenase